jgi:hypothetical protein
VTLTRLLVLSLLLTAAVEPLCLRAAVPQSSSGVQSGREGSWSATSRTGLTLKGTWTAVADPKTGAVTGTWTLDGAQGKTAMRGGWSAAKSPKGWTGAWRAVVTGRKGEYSGSWDATVDLKPDAPFAGLFELALKDVVSGGWRAGGQSGAWSIRAYSEGLRPSDSPARALARRFAGSLRSRRSLAALALVMAPGEL